MLDFHAFLRHSYFRHTSMKTLDWPILMLTYTHLFWLCWADYILDSVFQFCDENGYKYVTFADFKQENLYFGNSTRFAFNQGIRIRSLKLEEDFHMMEDMDMLVSYFLQTMIL